MLDKEQKIAIEYMARSGLTDREIADKLDLDYIMFIREKQSDSDLMSLMAAIRESKVTEIESALYNRAKGYNSVERHEIIHKDGGTTQKTIEKYINPDVNAIKFYLINQSNGKWRDIKTVAGDSDNPLTLASLVSQLDSVGETD